MENQGKAIPFITYDPTKSEFRINDDAVKFLNSLPQPLGVISVAGMYRTGKSYLLNRMILNKQSGFGVGPSVNPCTKGLWIWDQCIPGFTPEGEPIKLLVIDTEGIGALDEDQNHDIKIFSLAILLSSYFIYNSVGSIDENAIQSLSLVINLTKHIHLKAQGSNEDVDPEEYSNYFPSFMWVVRDFSLQLVDEEGEMMTSKEYLEKALMPQKGFSDNIEQKNRIRRLLKSFFKETDCTTIIRPLTKEEDLQNLDKMEFEKLRPEFIDQVMLLRRKVINRVKPKALNSKAISGEMLCSLSKSYIDAFNKGAVPNIESAWTYICKNECLKALHEGLEKYDMCLKDSLYGKLPLEESDLLSHHKEAKETAIREFKNNAVGELSMDYLNDLKLKIKQKYNTVKTENEKETKKACQSFLSQSYTIIEKKLKNNEFTNFSDYEKEIKAFQHYIIENGPPGPNRNMVTLDFLIRATTEASDYIIKTVKNSWDIEKALTVDKIKKLENSINETAANTKKDKEVFARKITTLEATKTELEAKEMNLKENLNFINKERDSLLKQMKEKEDEWNKNGKQKDMVTATKISELEGIIKAKEREQKISMSEIEKKEALFEQKKQFLDAQIEEYKKKEATSSATLASLKKETSSTMKEIKTKCDTDMKSLNAAMQNMKDKLSEAESSLLDIKQKYESDMQKWTQKEKSLREELETTSIKASELNEQLVKFKNAHTKEIAELTNARNKEMEESSAKFKNMETQLTASIETQKNARSKVEKDCAMLTQQVTFCEQKLKESKKQLEDAEKTHQSMVQALGMKADSDVKDFAQIDQMKAQHLEEIKKLENEFESVKSRLSEQVDQLTDANNDLECKLKASLDENEKMNQETDATIKEYNDQKATLELKIKEADSMKNKVLTDAELTYQKKIKEIEDQLEVKEQQSREEIANVQKLSEESLAQLKNVYEMEKERMEHRMIEEREKADKKLATHTDELEQKVKDEQQLRSEESNQLQEEIREIEQQSQAILAQLESDNSILKQKNDSYEALLKESKENNEKVQQMHQSTLEQQQSNFNQEKDALNQKIEKISLESSSKERQLTTLENKVEMMKSELEKREAHFEEIRKEATFEKGSLIEKFEALSLKYSKLQDDFMQREHELTRDIALYKQQISYNSNDITKMGKEKEELVKDYEEKLKEQKADIEQRFSEKIEKVQVERDLYAQNLEAKRKTFKEKELNLKNDISKLEKENSLFTEKVKGLENRLTSQETKFKEEQKAREDLLSKTAQPKGNDTYKAEYDKMLTAYQKLEKEYEEVYSNFDREKTLWNDRSKFFEIELENSKTYNTESQNKFDQTIQQMNKKHAAEKKEMETGFMQTLTSTEAKYSTKLKEEQKANQIVLAEMHTKVKQLEKEIRQLQERIKDEQKSKTAELSTRDKQLSELLEAERQMNKELKTSSEEKDVRLEEFKKIIEKEKEVHKAKQTESETKLKESESKRGIQVFEFEKERTKWSMEKDNLMSKASELTESIQMLEKKKEELIKENVKLKNDKPMRKPMYSGITNGSLYGASRFTSNLCKSVLGNGKEKENQSQQDDTKSTYSNMSSKDEKLNKSKNEEEKTKSKDAPMIAKLN